MIKPKQIKITRSHSIDLTPGKIYDVIKWCDVAKATPQVIADSGQELTIMSSKWEPVIQPGDPVWAWDSNKRLKVKALYIGKSQASIDYPYYVDILSSQGFQESNKFANIEWRYKKKKITIEELVKKAGINLDEYEVVE